MSLAQGAAIFGCDGLTLAASERDFHRDADPFGFILFARNIENPDQVRRLTGDLRASVGRDAPVFVDQEGGRVQRLRPPHWRDWPAPLDMVAQVMALAPDRALEAAERALWLRYRIIAAELLAVGIDGNCAPCADVLSAVTHPFLRNRCYSDDPYAVAGLARAVAAAHLAGGVLPVIKHMPGHGRANADTHHDLPTVTASAEVLEATDFVPFRALRALPLAMTAHIVFSAFDDAPATCSAAMIKVIRDSIGFGGLLMSDDIGMQALPGTKAERAAAAIAAGCDVVLECNGDLSERVAVAAAAGTMTAAAQARADAALAARHPPEPADLAGLEAELSGLAAGACHV
ncbi:beta-N-acetylhexosaminidase [Paracoccaceae bacterium Fryx2]|nr:beta-N-acetylhexosaminidase [Paracoccaceae bacterium Fryx2]